MLQYLAAFSLSNNSIIEVLVKECKNSGIFLILKSHKYKINFISRLKSGIYLKYYGFT